MATRRCSCSDEPTSGLDPQSREQIWTAITAAAEQGAAVLVTTHYLDEAEDYCDRVLLLSSGRVVAKGPARTVLDERELRQAALISASHAEEARRLESFRSAIDSRVGAGRLAVFFSDDDDLERFTRDVRESLGGAVELQVRQPAGGPAPPRRRRVRGVQPEWRGVPMTRTVQLSRLTGSS